MVSGAQQAAGAQHVSQTSHLVVAGVDEDEEPRERPGEAACPGVDGSRTGPEGAQPCQVRPALATALEEAVRGQAVEAVAE